MHDSILRLLSLFKATSEIPVCSHILSTIDWEKEKHSVTLMAKAFFLLFFFLNLHDCPISFLSSGPLPQSLPQSRTVTLVLS